jgi:glutaredoxin
VKELLSNHNIEYQEYNVAADRGKAKEMIIKTQQKSVPVVVIDDENIVIGYDQKKLSELLDIKN